MGTYRSIVVVSDSIYNKIELYRKFLEKSEFGCSLNDTLVISDSSVEGIPSTELNDVETFLYLHGILNKDQYNCHISSLKEKSRMYQNAIYYMLFCEDKYSTEAYDESLKIQINETKVYSIGILDENLPCEDDDGSLKEELNCLKLLVLAMAICKANETRTKTEFESSYMCADIKLDFVDIYYAVMHLLCNDADLINEKEREILMNKEHIAVLRTKKDSICEGIFDQIEIPKTGLKPKFSDYKSADVLQREMEISYKIGADACNDAIRQNIETARRALAIEEKYGDERTIAIKNGYVEFEVTNNSNYHQKYMNITEVQDEEQLQQVAQPEDLLKKPSKDVSLDLVRLKALLPLAREFDKNKNPRPWFVILTTFSFALLFFVVCGVIYYIRYKTHGLVGVVNRDFIKVLIIPAAAMLACGALGLLIQFIRFLFSRFVFKTAYKALVKFLSESVMLVENIRKYINKYLTVFYNHHIKHSKIKKLTDANIVLANEIEQIKANVSPVNAMADVICLLNGKDISVTQLVADEKTGAESLSMKKHLESEIKTDTQIMCNDKSVNTVSPWAKTIAYGPGNINCGGER